MPFRRKKKPDAGGDRDGAPRPDGDPIPVDDGGDGGGSTAPPATGVDPSVPLIEAAELEALRFRAAERDSFEDRVLRIQADLDNFRRREGAERRRAAEEEVERVLSPVFDLLDTFGRAMSASSTSRDLDALVQGVELAVRELERGLGDLGIRRIDAAGRTLDPSLHRAVFQEPTAEAPPMTVLEVFASGWMRGERVLRPAMVKVAAPPVEGDPPTQEPDGEKSE